MGIAMVSIKPGQGGKAFKVFRGGKAFTVKSSFVRRFTVIMITAGILFTAQK
jgi:hypothetical protein